MKAGCILEFISTKRTLIYSDLVILCKMRLGIFPFKVIKKYFFSYIFHLLALPAICVISPVQANFKNNIVEFNVLALRADQAINLFGKQSNITILYRFDKIKNHKTNEVKGIYSIKAAIVKLLEGTRLLHEFDSVMV